MTVIYTGIIELENAISSRFASCSDFVIRRFYVEKNYCFVCSLRELASREYVAERIIKPLTELKENDFDGFENVLTASVIAECSDIDEICGALCGGSAFVSLESDRLYTALCSADTYFGRSSGKSETDITTKGPQAGFVEDVEKNICLLRRIIRSPDLKCETFTRGSVTHTRIALMYIEGRANEKTVNASREKLKKLTASVIVDSGNVEQLMRDKKYGFFPSFGSTEKVDKVSSLLAAGRVAVICDGSPFVVTAPFVFIEAIQSAEDYLRTPYYATFMRALRLLSLLTALYLPSVYLILVEKRHELLPEAVYRMIDELRKDIPVSLFVELLFMLLIFEMLREVGIRMPRTVGDAVGIVGSIIIGDAATRAGIASTSVILVIAISAVANFVVPVYMNATVLLRLLFLIVSEIASFAGLVTVSCAVLCGMCAKAELDTPYMTPMTPFSKKGMEDFILSIPQKVLGRKEKM